MNKSVGSFKVESGQIIISDPCYDKPNSKKTKHLPFNGILPAKNGKWQAEIVMSDEGSWGDRVAYLVCYHPEHRIDENSCEMEEVIDFEVGVDSGQAGVFDAKYYNDDDSIKGLERLYDRTPINVAEPWYSMCCDRTLHKDQAGVIPFGAVSSSGEGDGCYKCLVKKDGDEVVGVLIDFGVL